MRIHEITDPAMLPALAAEWDALLDDSATRSVYQSYEWLRTWWRHCGRGQLRVLAGRSQGRLRCLAPLMLTTEHVLGIPFRRLRFIGSDAAGTIRRNLFDRTFSIDRRCGWSDVLDFLYRPQDIEAVRDILAHLQGETERWDTLDLREFPAASPSVALVDEILGSRHTVVRETAAQVAVVSLENDMESYVKTRTRNWRKNIRRAFRRTEALPDTVVRTYRSPEQVANILPAVVETEQKSWQGQRGVGAFSESKVAAFHRDLAVALAARDRFVLYTLESRGRLICYQYALRCHGRLHFHTTAMDPAFTSGSPGLYLQLKALERAFSEGLSTVVLGRGPETYKHKLKTDDEDRIRVTVFRTGLVPRLLASSEFKARPALRRLWLGARTVGQSCRG
ncbi:MAG: GNAT family N-acetyltransferase [Sedimentisphaerales bacterium]|nr:GNAT family N-acetyltransferase [Sedimentisphaerales bacterium]